MANLLKGLTRRLGVWGMFFLACGLVLMLLVAWCIGYFIRSSQAVEAELARIRQAGEPIGPDDLERIYQYPPEDEDTTALWLQAVVPLEGPDFNIDARPLPIVGESQAEIPLPPEPWPELEAAEQLLDKYSTSLQLLHEAAEQGGAARYPSDFSQGVIMLQPHLGQLRAGARLLALEAHVRAHQGDPHGAAEAIHALFLLADSLKREPAITAQLVDNACWGIAEDLLRRMLPCVAFSDEDLVRLQADLRAADYKDRVHQAMLGERVTAIMHFQDPGSMAGPGPAALFFRLTNRGSFLEYLQFMDQLLQATEKPWPEMLDAVQLAGAKAEQKAEGGVTPGQIGRVLTTLLLPALQAFYTSMAQGAAMNDATDAAIAVERYRRRHGKLPDRLDQLVPELLPEVPTDPFDGQPLRYAAREDGYIVYSIGIDRTDQGGQGDETGQPDLVFRVQLSPEAKEPSNQGTRASAPD